MLDALAYLEGVLTIPVNTNTAPGGNTPAVCTITPQAIGRIKEAYRPYPVRYEFAVTVEAVGNSVNDCTFFATLETITAQFEADQSAGGAYARVAVEDWTVQEITNGRAVVSTVVAVEKE